MEAGFAKYLDKGDGFFAKRIEIVKDRDGRTALHCAAEKGNTDVCKYLLGEVKINVDLRDRKGKTPLHCASLHGRYHAAVSLLENGANPNATTSQKFTPLHYAAQRAGMRYTITVDETEVPCLRMRMIWGVLQLLISNGAEIDAQADSGTPLQEAASRGLKEAVKILLDNNANPNMTFRYLFSPLVKSIEAGSFECVKQLLKAGADPNMRTLGLKPVEVAARNGHHEAVKILFPFTSPIPSVADWSYAGIMKYFRSIEVEAQLEQRKNEQFLLLKSKAKDAFEREDYNDAIYWYSEAESLKPEDAAVKSNRSLCWACLNEGYLALADGQKCVLLEPKWPKSHYREGMGWKLVEDFEKAAYSFYIGWRLNPKDKDFLEAYRDASGKQIQQTADAALELYFEGCNSREAQRSNSQLVAG
ncbi:hypothetical protein GH714_026209 [Hevea brasiliensis]|uniref:Uncharacterized protein n=1 Tax=Hevea brasiliensis TaxID=3981 RepID=A0A6A6NJB9_HEVBR|nr:hypothetical protein GH714_026209 [Hevea brasiliensis]